MERKALHFFSGLCVGTRVRAEGWSSNSTFEKDVKFLSAVPFSSSPRFDSEGQALDGVSISDLRSGGTGGSNTNWKTLYEAKSENLGQGDKVPHTPPFRGPENNRGLSFYTCSLVPVQGCVFIWDPRSLLQGTTLRLVYGLRLLSLGCVVASGVNWCEEFWILRKW